MKASKWTVVDTLFWLGGALVSAGAGLLALPAGLITAGVFCLVGCVLVDLGSETGKGADKA